MRLDVNWKTQKDHKYPSHIFTHWVAHIPKYPAVAMLYNRQSKLLSVTFGERKKVQRANRDIPSPMRMICYAGNLDKACRKTLAAIVVLRRRGEL